MPSPMTERSIFIVDAVPVRRKQRRTLVWSLTNFCAARTGVGESQTGASEIIGGMVRQLGHWMGVRGCMGSRGCGVRVRVQGRRCGLWLVWAASHAHAHMRMFRVQV